MFAKDDLDGHSLKVRQSQNMIIKQNIVVLDLDCFLNFNDIILVILASKKDDLIAYCTDRAISAFGQPHKWSHPRK